MDGRPMNGPPFTIIGLISGMVVVMLLYYFVGSNIEIGNDGLLSPAKITAITKDTGDVYKIDYEFYMDQKKYTASKKYKIDNKHLRDSLVNKNLPVIFVSNLPKKNELLITPSDFKKYSKHLPDSLKKITGLILNF